MRKEEHLSLNELHPRKKGRSLFLEKKLDKAVQEYILRLRDRGCPVNIHMVIATARGIAQAMDWTRLAEYGGSATLTNPGLSLFLRE